MSKKVTKAAQETARSSNLPQFPENCEQEEVHGVDKHAGIPAAWSAGAMKGWSVDDMVQYMSAIDLGHLAPAMKENGMDGRFLLECTQEDFLAIGVTALQCKKNHSRLPK